MAISNPRRIQLQPAQPVAPTSVTPVAQRPGLAQTVATKTADRYLKQRLTDSAVGAAIAGATGPLGIAGQVGLEMAPGIAGSLIGSFFRRGGKIHYMQEGGQIPMDAMPEPGLPTELKDIVEAIVMGEISIEAAIQAMRQMGVPEEMIMQAVEIIQTPQAGKGNGDAS